MTFPAIVGYFSFMTEPPFFHQEEDPHFASLYTGFYFALNIRAARHCNRGPRWVSHTMLRPPRVCCAHTKALKEKKKEGKTFFFFWLLVPADTFTAFGVAFSWASGPNKSTSTSLWAPPIPCATHTRDKCRGIYL